VKQRVAWVGRPWFFVAVVVLALNDHVLKGAWPGWVTGKLSDFAGLVVVATLAAVLAGPIWGTVLSGLAFVALKTVPGVAEGAAPFLGGGVTLRDPSDLTALTALAPLWWALRRDHPDQTARTRRGWIVLGLVAGVLATAATESPPPEQVVALGVSDDAIFAEVHLADGYGDRWLKTTDGGLTWTRVSPPKSLRTATTETSREGTFQATTWTMCADDGVCYRASSSFPAYSRGSSPTKETPPPPPRSTIERRASAADWVVDLSGASSRDFMDIAIQPGDSARAVSLGSNGTDVTCREPSGAWRRVNLVDQARDPGWVQSLFAFFGERSMVVPLAVILSLLGWLLAPGLGGKIVLQILTVVSAFGIYLLGILSYEVTRAYAYAIWFAVLSALILIAWRADRPAKVVLVPRDHRDGDASGPF